jgi:hypothetical protein
MKMNNQSRQTENPRSTPDESKSSQDTTKSTESFCLSNK